MPAATCAAAAAVVFLLDLVLPPGVAVGLLYVVPLLLAAYLPWTHSELAVAAGATVLALLGCLFPAPLDLDWMTLVSRGLSIALIWLTFAFLLRTDLFQRRLRPSMARLQALIDTAVDGVLMIDGHGIVRIYNRACERIFGYGADEVVGQNVRMLMPEPDRARHDSYIENYLRTGEAKIIGIGREVVGRRKDGSLVPLDLSVGEIEGGPARAFVGIVRDISDRKAAEADLRRLAALVESSQDAILSVTPEGIVSTWNDGATRLLRYSAVQAIGKPVFSLSPGRETGEMKRLLRRVCREGEVHRGDAQWRGKGGASLPVALTISPIRERGGRILGASIVAKDISEVRRAQRLLEEWARQLARSNAELERFASVAAHDLQEPLRKIQAFGSLLAAEAASQLSAESHEYIAYMRDAAQRMQRLIQDLRAYSRLDVEERQLAAVDLSKVVAEVLSDLSIAIETADATVDCEPLPVVRADEPQMRQLFQNLIGNALKFRAPDRAPRIRITCKLARASRSAGDGAAGTCEITVADNGIGFTPDQAQAIFEPFKRLHGHAEYEGSGIGLAICYKIVQRHRGEIHAAGARGEGASFVVTLPLERGRRTA